MVSHLPECLLALSRPSTHAPILVISARFLCQWYKTQEALVLYTLIQDLENIITIFIS